jgi:transcriptional regulator with XRE-family HTH domain
VIAGEALQRRLLGEFVRSHRERARPDRTAGRRRTPGLRREELAALAGISAVWCAWIEQGRPVQASTRALVRLAGALDLSQDDRATLFALAGRSDPLPDAQVDIDSAPDALRSVVEGFDHPAYALDRLSNAACWNASAAALMPGWLGEGRQRNLLRYAFLDRSARVLAPRWRDWARDALYDFRQDNAAQLDDPAVGALLEELRSDSLFFANTWDAEAPPDQDQALRAFLHPEGDLRSFVQHSFNPATQPAYRLVTLTPSSQTL